MVATFGAQYKPIPSVLLPRSLQDAYLARLSGIQNIDSPVPAVLHSRCFGGANRPRVRGENAQAFLDEFGRKNLHPDGYAGQTAGNPSRRCAIPKNLNGAASGEFAGPDDFSGREALINQVRRCGYR